MTVQQHFATNLILADDPLSTDCYSVRLLLEFLQLPYQSVYADVEPSFVQQEDELIYPTLLHPEPQISGVLPILHSIVVSTNTQSDWMPEHLSSHIQIWFDFNEQLKQSLGRLRQANIFANQFLVNEQDLILQAHHLLQVLDDHLCDQIIQQQHYLLADHATLADIIVFPQVALAWDAGVSLVSFLHIRRWINRIRGLPAFIPMAGLLAAV
ncbi:hypothetical protein GWI33_002972 [Rhynchophorus ferrugineus]|uniref:GST C-terminal domain-containing protein n=1 Tax=Rhynchophorus ferrugineus TaxID=354439 RepID=A0A834IGR4_RHYFE|nr:hypothetical protein GWI33_002972 [Rhynchophorus ferrugineus]